MSRTSRSIAILSVFVALLGAGIAAQAPTDGIKVHGDWTIEVRNPDGTLAGRHEFKNALTPTGQTTLASLLGGSRTATRQFWEVRLVSANANINTRVCQQVDCILLEAGDQAPFPTDGVVTVEIVGAPAPNAIRLRGSVTAIHDSGVSSVRTSQVAFGSGSTFSERILPATIPVVAGQVITVTVVISFS